jgi:hypothetical protein
VQYLKYGKPNLMFYSPNVQVKFFGYNPLAKGQLTGITTITTVFRGDSCLLKS